MPQSLLRELARELPPDLASTLRRRADSLRREVTWQRDTKKVAFDKAAAAGWSFARLGIVCVLVAYYQTVVALVLAAAPTRPALSLGEQVPLLVGSVRLDKELSAAIRALGPAFNAMLAEAGIPQRALEAVSGWDLLNRLGRDGDGD